MELLWILDFLERSVPRMVVANDPRPPSVIMTDAFLGEDGTAAGVGAVLLDHAARPERFMAARVPGATLALLQQETKFVINALEVLPVLFVRRMWANRLLHSRTFIFIDNDGARHSLMKAYSKSEAIQKVLRNIVSIQAEAPAYVWYCRVPSHSNIADAPSRGDISALVEGGAAQDVIPEDFWDLAGRRGSGA